MDLRNLGAILRHTAKAPNLGREHASAGMPQYDLMHDCLLLRDSLRVEEDASNSLHKTHIEFS